MALKNKLCTIEHNSQNTGMWLIKPQIPDRCIAFWRIFKTLYILHSTTYHRDDNDTCFSAQSIDCSVHGEYSNYVCNIYIYVFYIHI